MFLIVERWIRWLVKYHFEAVSALISDNKTGFRNLYDHGFLEFSEGVSFYLKSDTVVTNQRCSSRSKLVPRRCFRAASQK